MKFKRITALVLTLILLLSAVPALALGDTLTSLSGKASTYQYFMLGSSAISTTTFSHAEDGNAMGYSLSLKGEAPYATLNKIVSLPETVVNGIYTILQNGYPCQNGADYTSCPGLTDDELKYATGVALYAWMETNGLNGGVDASAVQPAAYPSLTEDKEHLSIVFTDGRYEVNLKSGFAMTDLATYERAFVAYAHMYNAACTDQPRTPSGSVSIDNATLWTPSGDRYIMEFTASPSGDYTELWIDGLPTSAEVFVADEPNSDGSIDFALSVPASELEDLELDLVMGHKLKTDRFGIYSDGRSNSQMIAFIGGAHGEVDREELPVNTFASQLVIKITDAASGAPLKGSRVELYNRDGESVIGTFSTHPENASDYTTYTSLMPGDYDYIITSVPTGYTAPTARYQFSIGADGKASGTTVIYIAAGINGNVTTLQPSDTERTNDMLTVKHGTTPLAGVSITVYDTSGSAVLTAASDSDGNLSVAQLAAGTYTYKLSAVPDTYAIDTVVRNLVVTDASISGDLDITVEQAQFSVKKTDASNAVVPGVTYSIYDASGSLINSVVTDASGIAKFTGLKRGTYTIKETATTGGLVLSTESYTFTVDSYWQNSSTPYLWDNGTAGSESFAPSTRNTKTIILKHNTTPIVGATISVVNSSGTAVLSVTTDANGVADVSSLAAGSYSYRVTTVPETYAIDGKQHSFTISDTGTISGYIDLPIERAMIKIKSGSLTGVSYSLFDSTNTVRATAITGNDGIATFLGLGLGSYYIAETETDSTLVYVPASGAKYHYVSTCSSMQYTTMTRAAAVAAGYTACTNCAIRPVKRYEFTVTNSWINPTTPYDFGNTGQASASTSTRADKTITVTYNRTTPVAGVVLTVYNSSGTSVLTAATNGNGIADLSSLPAGRYTYKVTSVPSTYAVDSTSRSFTIDSLGYISGEIDLAIKQVEVSVKKVAKDKTTPVSGVTYTLYNSNNTAVTTAVTGSDGIATFRALVPGSYTIKETSTVSGLTLSSETYSFTITSSWQNGEPKIFYSSSSVQTGTGIYLVCTLCSLAAVAMAGVLITRIRRNAA